MKSNNRIEWVLKDDKKRDVVVIFPGGGYERTSPREAMPVAKRIHEYGMHAVISWYRETKLFYPDIKYEGLNFLEEIKKHALVDHLYVMGFSAGAHYALMLSCEKVDLIDKTVLAYPVISTDDRIMHRGSFINLLGSLDSPYIDEVSLEKRITEKMNPVFMMHTADDQSVSVENSLRLSQTLNDHHVPFELHIYPRGRHGISLATKDVAFEGVDPLIFEQENKSVQGWFQLAMAFLKRRQNHD